MHVRTILLLVFLFARGLAVYAQVSDLSFERISLEQGLSESIVVDIIQDKRGFLWFGTEDGLNIYDGYRFEVIRNDPNDSLSLSYNQITDIYEDRDGWLWIGTFNGGLNKHDPQSEKFIHYRSDTDDPGSLSNDIVRTIYQDNKGTIWIGTEDGLNQLIPESSKNSNTKGSPPFIRYQNDPDDPYSLSHNTVRAIHEDRRGILWIGTDGGLNRMIPEKSVDAENTSPPRFVCYRHIPGNINSLSNNTVRIIFEDSEGTLWIGTDNGLNKLILESSNMEIDEPPLFVRYQNDPGDPNSLSHNAIYAICEDQSGGFWIGTNGGGLEKFDRGNEIFTHYLNNPRDPRSLSYNEIWSIYQDRSGLLWIGTYGGGINKVDMRKKQFFHYKMDPDNPNSLNEEIIWGICEDRFGTLWVGTHGGGLNKIDRQTNQYTFYQNDPEDPHSISSNIVRLILEDRHGTLWTGTNGGGINRFNRDTETFVSYQHDPENPESLSHNDIRALFEDSSGTLWIGTQGGGLNKCIPGEDGNSAVTFVHYRNTPEDNQSIGSDFIRVIHEDKHRQLWIGTLGQGMDKFDRDTETFVHYRSEKNNLHSLSNDYIFAIHEDSSGILWLGTFGGGLNKFDPEKGIFIHYTEIDGLSNDVIYGILEDNRGYLWLSTNNGLSRFDPEEETFKNYTVADGLQSNEFNGGSHFKSRSGEFFFGGINGFNAFFPENIMDNPYVPPVVITEFMKLNEVVKFDKPISEIKELRLTYKDYVFSFQFAALDYTAPEKNRYAYMMEGLDKNWIYTDAERRFASYTTLAPGQYTFRVKGSNNDGIWNEKGTSIRIIIIPPFWRALWFQAGLVIIGIALIVLWYQRRLRNVRLKTELQAAHDAQMSIMPQSDPKIKGLDISGICIPANSVGGDFFDYMWLNKEKTHFGVVVGDVSGKAMNAAMTAVMSSGMIFIETGEASSIQEAMTRVNRSLYFKIERQMFTALCLVSLDIKMKSFSFTNAGLHEPLLKSGNRVTELNSRGPKLPLGAKKDTAYQEQTVSLKSGDVIILITDGVPEAQNHARTFYGFDRLKKLIEKLDTRLLTASEIKMKIMQDVNLFSGSASQYDDLTIVVIKFEKGRSHS